MLKLSVESVEAITPQVAQDSLTELIAVSSKPKTEVNAISSLTNADSRVALLEAQLSEALQNNQNLLLMVRELRINIELKEELHKAQMESTKRYNKNGDSSTKPRTLLPFEPSPNKKRK